MRIRIAALFLMRRSGELILRMKTMEDAKKKKTIWIFLQDSLIKFKSFRAMAWHSIMVVFGLS